MARPRLDAEAIAGTLGGMELCPFAQAETL